MNAYELYAQVRNGVFRPTGIFACGNCNRLTLGADVRLRGVGGNSLVNSRESAEACCKPVECDVCGKPMPDSPKWVGRHAECGQLREVEQYRNRLDEATLVDYVEGEYLYYDRLRGDDYFCDMDGLMDALDGTDQAEWPEFVHPCVMQQHSIDIDQVLEHACEEGYEDMADCLGGTLELENAIKAFNESNKKALQSWTPDYTRKVAVPRPKPEGEDDGNEGTGSGDSIPS